MDGVKYKLVLDSLKKEILGGQYNSVRKFPSVTALARRFGETRSTVYRALAELAHQGLVSQKQGRGTFITHQGSARKIGLIMPGVVVSEFFRPIATTLIDLARANGYTLLFGETYSLDPELRVKEARELAAKMIREKVAGVIYQPFEATLNGKEMNQRILSVLDLKRIPVVLIDRDAVMPPARTDHDLVAINNVDASERLTGHLVDAGARNICFLTNYSDVPNIECRVRGFLAAKERLAGRRLRFEVVRGSAADLDFVRRMMRKRSRPDAVLCDSDTTAAFLRQTLDKLGYSVPDDVMLAGFDDVQLASLMTPPLTTVHQPCGEIGTQAFNRLLARIAGQDLLPTEILLRAPLVVRESTCRKAIAKNGKPGRTK